MRIAVVADIHGNLPALQAVLAEIDEQESMDVIAWAGDLAPGPFPVECLAALRARSEPVHWVSGNGERDIVLTWNGGFDAADPGALSRAHAAAALGPGERDTLASWPPSCVLDGVCVCHGSPSSVDEVLTRATPGPVLLGQLEEGRRGATLVVGGHTHQQMIRPLAGGVTYANAGSVGRPFEGDPAAYWVIVEDRVPQLRRTAYDVAAWIARVRASDFPRIDDCLEAAFDPLYDASWLTAYFEHAAGRAEDPGPPVALG